MIITNVIVGTHIPQVQRDLPLASSAHLIHTQLSEFSQTKTFEGLADVWVGVMEKLSLLMAICHCEQLPWHSVIIVDA